MKISRKNSKSRSRNLKKTAKRFAAYSAAAAATVAAQDRSANAIDIVHDLLPDVVIGAQPGLLFNVISGATTTPANEYSNYATGSFRLAGVYYPLIAGPAFSFNAGFVDPDGFTSVDNRYPTLLSVGVAVGPGMTFGANSGSLSSGNFGYLSNFDGVRGFVGLRFEIGAVLHYGWAEVTNVPGGGYGHEFGDGSILHGFGYNDTAGAPSLTVDTYDRFADLNDDGLINDEDWVIFRDHSQSDLSMLTPGEAYLLGDLDGDLDNDIDDFDLFRNAYEEANPGQTLGSQVPEPSAMILLAAGAAGLGTWRRRRAGKSA